MKREMAIGAAAAVLALTACGGGGQGKSSGSQASGASTPASAAASTGGGAGQSAAATEPGDTNRSFLTGAGGASQKDLLTQNRAKKQVTFKVITAYNAGNHGWNFDGYANGDMTMAVPKGWKVTMHFEQEDPSVPHSAGVAVASPSSLPASGSQATLAFSGASTSQFDQGLGPNKTEDFSFTADKAGNFLLLCGVAGHAQNGMWDHFNVVAGADSASIHFKKPS